MPTTEITPREAAEILGVSGRTLFRYAQEGRLTVRRTLGGHRRYDRAEIEALRATMDPAHA